MGAETHLVAELWAAAAGHAADHDVTGVRTPVAYKALKLGKHVLLEKPVATNMDDLRALKKAFDESKSQVVVSFPLRLTQHVQQAKQIIRSVSKSTSTLSQAV